MSMASTFGWVGTLAGPVLLKSIIPDKGIASSTLAPSVIVKRSNPNSFPKRKIVGMGSYFASLLIVSFSLCLHAQYTGLGDCNKVEHSFLWTHRSSNKRISLRFFTSYLKNRLCNTKKLCSYRGQYIRPSI